MTDIVERLRQRQMMQDVRGTGDRFTKQIAVPDALCQLASDDIERLRAELATLRAATASDQRAERDALREDALRYRWLRDCDRVSLYRGNLWLEGISSLDTAIDAAMAARTTDSEPEVPA